MSSQQLFTSVYGYDRVSSRDGKLNENNIFTELFEFNQDGDLISGSKFSETGILTQKRVLSEGEVIFDVSCDSLGRAIEFSFEGITHTAPFDEKAESDIYDFMFFELNMLAEDVMTLFE